MWASELSLVNIANSKDQILRQQPDLTFCLYSSAFFSANRQLKVNRYLSDIMSVKL